MSGETPIYDAICRDVGVPDDAEIGGAGSGTATSSERLTPQEPPSPGSAEDPVTSDLSIPADLYPSPTSDGHWSSCGPGR